VISIHDTANAVITNAELLAAALRITEGGGRPLPCAYGKKTPVTIHGVTDAAIVRDPVAFARYWWGRGQLYNVAEPTGFRFDVLDVDNHGERGSGFDALERLKQAGLLTGAWKLVRTPSGGQHLYFAPSGQRCGSIRGEHLDLKALGGYVLVPPSQVGGRRYEVLDERAPTGATLDWEAARALLLPPRPYRAPRPWRGSQKHLVGGSRASSAGTGTTACTGPAAAHSRRVTMTPSASLPTWRWPPGSAPTRSARRSSRLVRRPMMAGELSSFDQVPDEQVDRLAAWHHLRSPGRERDGVIAWLAEKHSIAPERGAPMADAALWRAQQWTQEQVEALSDAADGWTEQPVPLGAVPVLPAFPADVFPPWLADMVAALTESAQVPADLPGTSALSVLSAAMGGRARVLTREDHSEPVNLYNAVALPPGSRKSSVHATMTAPLLTAEKMLADAARKEITEVRTTRILADRAAVKAQKAAAEAAEQAARIAADAASSEQDRQKAEESKQKAEQDAVEMARVAEEIEVPVVPRLVADDITPEAAASLLADQGGRLAIMSAEGGPFVSLAGQYSRELNLEVLLKGWSGDMLRVDRKSRETEHIEHPALTLGLCVQTAMLRQIYRMPGFGGRGLLDRVLYSVPVNTVGYRSPRSRPVPEQVARDYALRMTGVVTEYAAWTGAAMLLRLDPAAAELLTQAEEALEPYLRPDGEFGHIAGWASKLIGTTARMAGLLHGAIYSGEAYKHPVRRDTMSKAIRLGRYFTDHALAAFDFMGADPAVGEARAVLAWIRRRGAAQFTQRDLHRAMQTRFRKAEDTEPALAMLSGSGWIRETKQPRDGRGRPAGPVFEVHPAVFRISRNV
jgi:replicative DNA helicase